MITFFLLTVTVAKRSSSTQHWKGPHLCPIGSVGCSTEHEVLGTELSLPATQVSRVALEAQTPALLRILRAAPALDHVFPFLLTLARIRFCGL